MVGTEADGSSRTWPAPRRWSRLGAISAIVLCGWLCAPAMAARQHVFSGSFGSSGTGSGEFVEPAGVGVNEATEDVYVVDKGNNRVEQFEADGAVVGEFDGSASPTGAFEAPEGLAVDNSRNPLDPSAGDVYVVDTGHDVVDKFSPSGTFISQLTAGSEGIPFGSLDGVAVDQNGTVWVYQASGEIDSFNDSLTNEFVSSLTSPFGSAPGFAVDSKDDLYVNRGAEVMAKLASTGEALIEEMDPERTTGATVDLLTDEAYIDNVTDVAVFSPAGKLIERIGSGSLTAGSGVAVNASRGTVYVADSSANRVDMFILEPISRPTILDASAKEVTERSASLEADIDPMGSDTTYDFRYGTQDCAEDPGACTTVPTPPGSLGAEFGHDSVSVQLQGLQPDTTYHYEVTASNELGRSTSADHVFTTQSAAASNQLPDGRAWEIVSPVDKGAATLEAITEAGGVIQAAANGEAMTYVANAPTEREAKGNPSHSLSQIMSVRGADGWVSQDIATPQSKPSGLVPGNPAEYKFFSLDLSQGLVEQLGEDETLLSPLATERTPYLRNDENGTYAPLVTAAAGHADVPTGTVFGGQVEFISATPDLSHIVLSSSAALTETPTPQGGLYEWSGGTLQLVSVASGGAVAAAPRLGAQNADVRHAISNDGNVIAWEGSVEENGEQVEHLFVSNMARGETNEADANQGGPPTPPERHTAQFQTADAEANTVFFTDAERLTPDSTAKNTYPPAPDLYAFDTASGKLTDLTVDHNEGESAEVQGVVPGAAEDGEAIYFVARGVLTNAPNARGEAATSGANNLYVARRNAGAWTTTFIAALSNEDSPDWQAGSGSGLDLATVSSRVSPDGQYLAFMSNRTLTGYDNLDAASGQPDEEVFLYNADSEQLICASCNPTGSRPTGEFDSGESGESSRLLVDRFETWAGRWLAGSVPGWTSVDLVHALYQSRYLSDTGRLFFNSPDDLVPQATNGKEDVYEYEPQGVPHNSNACSSTSAGFVASADGCLALISSGTASEESAFLDASEQSASGEPGGDVFFLTTAALVPEDVNGTFDIYDAHECTQASPCFVPANTAPPAPCASTDACRPAATPQLSPSGAPASTAVSGNGNVFGPSSATKATKTPASRKPLTNQQKLAKALKACHKKRSRRARAACERQARRKYRIKTPLPHKTIARPKR
jgi:DNA-binding beta-propeller fold protein YncE